jgi:hypothetical protein
LPTKLKEAKVGASFHIIAIHDTPIPVANRRLSLCDSKLPVDKDKGVFDKYQVPDIGKAGCQAVLRGRDPLITLYESGVIPEDISTSKSAQ